MGRTFWSSGAEDMMSFISDSISSDHSSTPAAYAPS